MKKSKELNPVIDFIDSLDDNMVKKKDDMNWIKNYSKNDKQTKASELYNRAETKVIEIMNEMEDKELSEDNIDEVISRIEYFKTTKNNISANIGFHPAIFVLIITLGATMLWDMAVKTLEACNLDNGISYLLLFIIVFSAFSFIIYAHLLNPKQKEYQTMLYKEGVLNLLKERLEKKKKSIKNNNSKNLVQKKGE